jgi:hypothetical protein
METIISGIVLEVKKPDSALQEIQQVTFRVRWIEKEESVYLIYPAAIAIRKNDCIYAKCHKCINKEGRLDCYTVSRPPMILINKDKETMINNISFFLKIKYPEASSFYNDIVVEAVEEDKVYEYITSCAENYHCYRNNDILDMFGHNDYDIKAFLESWYREYNLRELKLLGVTPENIENYNKSCKEIFEQCIKNPYVIYTLTIEQCDDIMERLNKVPKDEREKGLIVRQLYNNAILKQWFCCPTNTLSKQFPLIKRHVESLKSDYNVVVDLQSVYLQKYHTIETKVAEFIIKYVSEDPVNNHLDPINVPYIGKNKKEFVRYIALENDTLSEDQRVAVQAALDHKLLMVLGRAGTGKSSTIGEIVKNIEVRGLTYLMTGFTGKSVSRIQEVTKKKAFTMHRLIYEALKHKKDEAFDYVIIDEISMVTTQLFYDFIKCYTKVNQFLFVGDNNQLQPIDAGSFLSELLKASVVPTYYLTKNHRVIDNGCDGKKKDGILLNANMIIDHDSEYPFEFEETENFQIIHGEMNCVFDMVQLYYDAGVSIDDIMIISPYKDYVRELNLGVKNIYNKNSPTVVDGRGTRWSVGDKVMLLKNVKQILYNGQQGTITKVDQIYVTIDFGEPGIHEFKLNSKYKKDNKHVKGENDQYDNMKNDEMNVYKLQHSYANTLHKSQGQEASIVIGYFPSSVKESNFLNKPLLYTLITRAREIANIVTPNTEILVNAVNKKPSFRYENLNQRLKVLPPFKPFRMVFVKTPTITVQDLLSTDPDLEGMEEEEYYED